MLFLSYKQYHNSKQEYQIYLFLFFVAMQLYLPTKAAITWGVLVSVATNKFTLA
jgi:hypothetical protein